MLHTIAVVVKQTVINGICDSYKWYHKNINAKFLIQVHKYIT